WRPHNRPLHGLLGVATRRAETAGGGSAAEVDLDVVTLPEARALRAILLRAKAGATGTTAGRAAGDRAAAGVGGGRAPLPVGRGDAGRDPRVAGRRRAGRARAAQPGH